MAPNSPNRVGLALVLFFVLHLAYSADECQKGCQGPDGALKLAPGTTYKYDYDGKINIELSSAKDQQTSTEVKATVLLTQQADCSQVLRLQNVQIVGPDGKKRSGIPDLEKPVVLNNKNGVLNDFICTEPGEHQNSLNLKRAIASFFQVSQDKNTEIDVFGQCPTQTYKSEDGGIITISKSKNLNKCAFREAITHNYITSTFDIHSEIQSSPVLNSNLDSKHKIKNGVLDSATIIENYLFVPFSVGKNGAKATVETKLTLIGTSKDNPTTKCKIPKSIIFENPQSVVAPKSNVNTILKKVKEISEKIATNVEDSTAIQFVNLVRLLRVSKKADILSVYNQVRSGAGLPDKEGAKKIFLDAILTSGNGDTIEVAIELLKNKELGPFEEKQLYLGLSRARQVTENSIKTATDLINRPNLPREAFLGIGSLAGRYCSTNNCEKVEVINKIIQKFLSKLGDLKAANRKEESDMIYVLKGLTNIGYLNDAILSKLVSLAEDKKQPTRLRVATLEAFLASPCKDKFRDSALKTLKDIQQDSEIRIKAYLVLAQCPNDKIGNAIKALLDEEKSNQVGGFISTHIKNLRSSSNPDKALAKQHLGFVHTPNRFTFDPRKYSFNGELSYSIDAIGAANNIEGNVIYSQNSWLPRSANLNLTAEVFGQRFNFLEVAARQENLDRVIEHYLGPQGVLRKATLQQNWDNAVKPVENLLKSLKEKVDKSLRSRRDVSKADIDAINKKVLIKSNELDKNLDLDLSIKNFGSEIAFMNSFDVTDKLTPQSIVDKLVGKLNEGLDKLKSFDETLRSNLLFLDAELSYPTSLGFPLRLGIDGSANIQVKASGAIDARELLTKGAEKDINLKISLIPSATVTVIGRFTFDTPLLQNGLKVASTLHTSSGGDLLVKSFKEGLGLDVKFSIPLQKQELINLKHDIIFQTRENGVALQDTKLKFSQNKDLSICVDQLKSYIGLEFCADINGPNLSGKKVPILPFPFSGDAKASVRIERGEIDTFHYRREFFTAKEGKMGVEALFETLDKNNKKGISLNLEGYSSPDKYVKLILKSPIKNAEAEARIVSNDKEKVIAVYFKDEDRVYSAKAGLKIDGGSDKTIYNPIIEYITPESKSPQVPPFHVEGKLIAEKNGENVKYTLDNVKLVIPGQKTISINGNFGTDGPAQFTDLTLSDGSLSGTVKGRIQAQPNLLKLQAEFQNTMNPTLNFNVKGEFRRQKDIDSASSNIQVIHGQDLSSKTNIITLINSYTYKSPKEFSTKNKFSYPAVKINAQLDVEKGLKSLDYVTFLQYSDVKIGSDLKAKVNTKAVGDYNIEFDIYGQKNRVDLKSSRLIVGGDDSKIENSLSVNGRKLEINGKVKHHVRPNDVNVGADLVIKTPNNKVPWKLNEALKLNPREIDTHLKLLSGSSPIIDILLKANKNGNANGFIKVNFKDVLSINGQIKAQKGAGSGDILIEAKTFKKSAKAETTFTIHNPTYNLDFTLYPAFNEDKNKKVAVSTKNKYSGTTLDSASTLDLLGSKFEFNTKSTLANPLNGKSTIDADLTLPNKRYLTLKYLRDRSTKDSVINSDNLLSVSDAESKDKPPRSFAVKYNAKNTNINEGVLDITGNVEVTDPVKGKVLNVDGTLKRQNVGGTWKVDFTNKIVAPLLDENTIETTLNSEYKDLVGSFVLKSSARPDLKIDIQGKYDATTEISKPKSGDLAVQITLPYEVLSSIKTHHTLAVKLPKEGEQASLNLVAEIQTVSSNANMNLDTKGEWKFVGDRKTGSGTYHGEMKQPTKQALDLSGSYLIDIEKRTGTLKGGFRAILPQTKIIEGSATISKLSPKEATLEASLNLPTETFKTNKLSIKNKISEDNRGFNSNLEFVTDGKKYVGTAELSLDKKEPRFDVKLTYPDGKLSQYAASLKRPGQNEVIATVKALSERRDFLLDGSLEVRAESLNSFLIKLTANSPKLNVKDFSAKIGNEGSGDGKTLNIQITSAGKNILSGTATVSSREEQGKFIVEGSGNFKVENAAKSGNFKYIRTSLTSEKNGETGEEISFDATLGNKAIDAELKVTNKEFRYLNSYCEESKQCAHVEIDAKTSVDDISRFSNEIEITIDLRVLGIPNEFGLKAVTNRQNWKLDHTVDVHFENAANKYQYSLYVHPKEVGVYLTTPKRIIALEANADIPTTDLKEGGKASGEISFYTDKKNNPTSKSSLKGSVDVNVEKRSIDAEAVLNIIGQNKPLSIKYSRTVPKLDLIPSASEELILDIFAKPDQKLIIKQTTSGQIDKQTYKAQGENILIIKSAGLGVDINIKDVASIDPKAFTGSYEGVALITISGKKYDSAIKLSVSPKEAYFLSKHLNDVLLEAKSDINLQKGLININTHTSGIGLKPLETTLEIKNYNSLKFTQYLKDDPNTKLLVSAAFIPGQIADARAEFQTGGAKKELFHASLNLDDKNFLHPDAGMKSENVKEFSNTVKDIVLTQSKKLAEKIREGNLKLSEDIKNVVQTAKETVPDVTQTKQFYESEIGKFKDELATDKTLQDLGVLLKKIVNAVLSTTSTVISSVNEVVEKLVATINNTTRGIIKTLQAEVFPKIKEIIQKLVTAAENILDKVSEVIFVYIAKIAEILEALQPHLKAISVTLTEITEEIGRFIYKTYESIKDAVLEQIKHLKDEIKASPIIAELKAQYEELIKNGLPSQEVLVNTMKAITGTLKELVVIPEFQKVIDMVEKYLEKKMTNKQVDDSAELSKIGNTFIDACTKFSAAISKEAVPEIFRGIRIPAINLDLLKRIPSGGGAIRVSVLEYLAREDVTPLLKFVARLILRPRDFILPAELNGIIHTQLIYTFDQKVYLFPGSCSYLAARDAVNGNFSVIATYDKNSLSAITLNDKSGSITISKNKVLLNNAESDLPIHKGSLHAVFNGLFFALSSDSGVTIKCDLSVEKGCGVEVSGFYHGQLRGLLGNGNNEEFDDLTLPNGKIVSHVNELAPGYAVVSGCPAVAAVDAQPKPNEKCDKLFSWGSPLSACYPFVSSEKSKRGCEYAAAANVVDFEQSSAMEYAWYCHKAGVPVIVPKEQSLTCKNSLTPKKLEDSFDVKLPGKVADVVLVINTNKHSEPLYKEYIQPLVAELIKEYKTKGVTDIDFNIIVYGGENIKPNLVTVKGKLAIKENAPNLKFGEPQKPFKLVTGIEDVDKLIGFLKTVLHEIKTGTEFLASSVEIANYPFRAEALRTVIVATNEGCEFASALPLQLTGAILPSSKNVEFIVIRPVKDLKVKDAKTTKDVIGFNNENVFTGEGCKTKPFGDPALQKDLSFDDACTSFTQNVGGTTFVADNLLANKASKQSLVQIIAKNIVAQSLKKQIQMECTCEYGLGAMTPFNRCKVVDVKEK